LFLGILGSGVCIGSVGGMMSFCGVGGIIIFFGMVIISGILFLRSSILEVISFISDGRKSCKISLISID
jgi:hypothetical protein